MNKKWINSALNCGSHSSFESVSSDHRIVTAKICLSLCRNTMQTTKTTYYDWFLLNNRDISNKYMIMLSNKSDVHPEISKTLMPNDKHENFINIRMEAIAECIPTKLRVLWETLTVKKK